MKSSANGHNGNGASGASNGSTNGANKDKAAIALKQGQDQAFVPVQDGEAPVAKPPTPLTKTEAFDQPVILQQTSLWSRAIMMGIVGVTTFVVGWAAFARIEEAVPAAGKLEPQGQVQNLQAPVGGVVQEILVKAGDRVKKGQLLIRFDPRSAEAQLRSLEQIRRNYQQEIAFYRSVLEGGSVSDLPDNLPPEVLSLARSRAELIAENALFRTQLGGASGEGLTADQQIRLSVGQAQTASLMSAARLEVTQLQDQLSQAQLQLASARQTLSVDEGILRDIQVPVAEGALSRIQGLRQQQEVTKGRAEVNRLIQEVRRLRAAIAQAQQRVLSTNAQLSSDKLDRIAANEKQIASIEDQLNKNIVDANSRLAELESQLKQAELTQEYQAVRAPIDGVVFDVQPKGPGFVATTSEPILKVVPSDRFIAQVFITNKDIGFVREGMKVDVRIDSFPFSEFGDIEGTLVQIGSDALPPDQVNQFWRFPAKIELDSQTLNVEGTSIPLQSGMSITANIITRDRTVLSIFTDLFSRRIESLKTVR